MDAKQTEKVDKYEDVVQFGNAGWRHRYYSTKFFVRSAEQMAELQVKIRQAYVEGLAWVFAYYYKGCVSWEWYYPFHYAPHAADLVNCDKVKIEWNMGQPLCPLQQLMAVLPKQSAHAVPSCYRYLLGSPTSPIIDLYPSNFKLDVNGAAFAWMGVNLLPYIEMPRLLKAMADADENETNLTINE